jgi:hypothetical protein
MITSILPPFVPSAVQLAEQRLLANTEELHQAEQALREASELVKSEIRRLLFAREYARVRFANLCAEHAELKRQLRSQ